MVCTWVVWVDGALVLSLEIQRVRFCLSLGCKDGISNSCRVLAFRKGILVAAASYWDSFYFFVFELNFKSIVAWVTNPSSVP